MNCNILVLSAALEVAASKTCAMSSTESDSSSEDSADEYLEKEREMRIKIVKYVEEIVPKYSLSEFRHHFRLSRGTTEILIGKYNTIREKIYVGGWPEVSGEKTVLMSLWYLANTETFREIADRFNVAISTAHKEIHKFAKSVASLHNEYIKWPTRLEAYHISNGFAQKGGFGNVIGAIDGCHIRVRKPISDGNDYINRKGYASIILQGVVDHQKRFIDISVGHPGSLHDARVLRKSKLFLTIEEHDICYSNYFLLGDSAYPSLQWLVPPFRDTGLLTNEELLFNTKHSKARVVVEHAFGLLKGRFRRLFHFENLSLVAITNLIATACTLHNLCIIQDDDDGENFIENLENFHVDIDPEDIPDVAAVDRRQEILLTL
ncbi:hypothetical protein MML48_1g01257 [Holotrichia oblita]|uniref:Uncharacterized protein n=4 Tax=Holotrichia oblita TaxID=644536 RepID=A0ACB9SJC6_HOLOL|nr:hypothetical protein MML48_9g00013041 [Holotrichia oblita]KAI4455770.1 hypothetical protein MML48_9g00002250 [Holotrichia oblita]KAI4459444.1 hypothetical protein MML48_6g00007520 [Holotrichia oblita]KAI4469893.1 hypothetical protein MML48_1g01257 [Holotrichia oblita]